MQFKKIIPWLLVLIALAVAVWVGAFYYNYLRGIGPAISSPAADIVQVIQQDATQQNSPFTMPPGFQLSIFAKNLKGPRVLILDPNNYLTVSDPSAGKIFSFDLKDGTKNIVTTAEGLNHPHGLAFYCPDQINNCNLYVAETNQINLFRYDPLTRKTSNKKKIIDLPSGGNHITRTLLIKNDKLYISIGSSCNVCNESDPRRAKIFSADLDGSNFQEFAKGLRNSVFMITNPKDNKIWATDMGRDLLGDNIPPDEINVIEQGKNYGWPICYGDNIHDTKFDKNTYVRNPCLAPFETPSQIDIPAHSAPLGLAFVPENSNWPKEYWGNLLVAYHGSWNRSIPTGYKVVRMILDDKQNLVKTEDFITGWLLPDNKTLGRPVDIIFDKTGNAYISDDKSGVIYKLEYTK